MNEGRKTDKKQKDVVLMHSSCAWYGACHACELDYVFYNLNRDDVGVGPADPKLAEKVSAAWVSFARTGNPSTDEIVWENITLRIVPLW